MQQNSEELELCCPSFNALASATAAAAKVSAEANSVASGDEEEFEFVTPAFPKDGGSQPIFPVFNRDLLLGDEETKPESEERELKSVLNHNILLDYRNQDWKANDAVLSTVRTPLQSFFREDHDPGSSSDSESDSDELEGVAPESFCVWVPRSPASERCKKSNSTGTSSSGLVSKKWRLRDLMRRCKSDGKESFVFLREKGKEGKNDVIEKKRGIVKVKGKEGSSAHEEFYVKSRAVKEGEKRKSYLPYRQELVGLFGSPNARAMPKMG